MKFQENKPTLDALSRIVEMMGSLTATYTTRTGLVGVTTGLAQTVLGTRDCRKYFYDFKIIILRKMGKQGGI